MALIFKNSIITPDGTELISKDRHDYVVYKDKNGQVFGIDGGNEYLRRTHDAVNCGIDTSITSDSKIEEIREVFKWGSYGKEGKDQLKVRFLKELSNSHIEAILKIDKLYEKLKEVFERELEYRKKNNINLID